MQVINNWANVEMSSFSSSSVNVMIGLYSIILRRGIMHLFDQPATHPIFATLFDVSAGGRWFPSGCTTWVSAGQSTP